MSLVLLGVNHKTAPIEVRERLAISQCALPDAVRALLSVPGVQEAMLLSTCNRVEVLAWVEPASTPIERFLEDHFQLSSAMLAPHLYCHRDRDAVRHLFRVASSLDSMVVGEPQILGQVKDAYTAARKIGAVDSQLERLLQCAFATAKRVRSETQIGSTTVSIASVAVDLAHKIFGTLEGKKVFLVGAGKMSELTARHLAQQGASAIMVTNRTQERAERLAENFCGAITPSVIPYEQLHEAAVQADIIISSTGAPHPIFRKEHGQLFLQRRKNKPMFFIDIAVPRDVAPEMNRLDGIFVYDIDDLQSVAASHLAERSSEAEAAEALVADEVDRYQRKLQSMSAAPAIVALQRQAESLRQAELSRLHARLQSLTPEQYASVEALTRGLVNKFLHPPMQALKDAAGNADSSKLELLRDVYDLSSTPAHDAVVEMPVPKSPAAEEAVTAANTGRLEHKG
jgi:glutamyl-tRNA reductase